MIQSPGAGVRAGMNGAMALDDGSRLRQPGLLARWRVRRPCPAGRMIGPDGCTDSEDAAALILAIARSADRDAFVRLFRHFAPRVKTYLLRLGAAPALAEELAQEVMLTVWRKAGGFDPARGGAATWIFTIARNLRIDGLRHERHGDGPAVAAAAEPPPAPPAADTLLAAAEQEARVRTMLQRLPAEQLQVIHLAFFEDKPHSAIERELGIPLGTVKSRLRLAMLRLRSLLDDAP